MRTGLGLSIVKHGLHIHNACLTLESAPDKGTSINQEFPSDLYLNEKA